MSDHSQAIALNRRARFEELRFRFLEGRFVLLPRQNNLTLAAALRLPSETKLPQLRETLKKENLRFWEKKTI